MGLDLAVPASDDLEESLEAAAGELGQRDLRPLAAQDTLTVKARYPQLLQVCGQASASRLTVIRRRTAHLNDPDLKGRAAAVRVSVKSQDSTGGGTGRAPGTGAHREGGVGPAGAAGNPEVRGYRPVAHRAHHRSGTPCLPYCCEHLGHCLVRVLRRHIRHRAIVAVTPSYTCAYQ